MPDAERPPVPTCDPASRAVGTPARVYTCDRCGARMLERQCKVTCANCGARLDCSDLNIHFDNGTINE